MNDQKVSIIIPCKEVDSFVRECIQHCLKLNYEDFEIILLPDNPAEEDLGNVEIISTGHVKPSLKRNIGIENSKGKIIAFIDADAYPHKDWLKNAIKYFVDESVGAVGGPNLTPPQDNFQQQVYGEILYSRLCLNSFATGMFSKNKNQVCEELPSCNLLVRKSLFFKKIGFFNTSLLTAEDALLCTKIRDAGYKIIYEENSIVYHHRRSSIVPFLKQVWIFGRDRATLIRNHFDWKMISHFLPSLFVLGLLLGAFLSFLNNDVKNIYFLMIFVYLIITAFESITKKNSKMIIPVFFGIIVTHITYGVGFLRGLLVRNRMLMESH